jgi:2-oxoisovalerate dehydrogenase E2 component (dihydrolipoyl transacylase)
MESCLTQSTTELFYLPDLGEGLPDAEIFEWFVKEGDHVTEFQPLVSMETAKAVVDVPCPQSGIITKLYGKPGDLIKTGAPLVAFQSQENQELKVNLSTVVGQLQTSDYIDQQQFIIGSTNDELCRVKTTPAVRLRAKQLGIDLTTIRPSGEYHVITMRDLEQAPTTDKLDQSYEPLQGVRRSMHTSMTNASKDPVSVTIFDEADLHTWQPKTDITLRMIRALQQACTEEPALNVWFDSKSCARKCLKQINIGLAMDHENQLFAPVIYDVANLSDAEIRAQINQYKIAVKNRTLNSEQLKNATITLSNFGQFGGKFASPIIVPPTVAIIAVGKIYSGVVVTQDGDIAAHKLAPLSLSFDHRVITGGEATRFLSTMIRVLQE